MIEVYIRRWGTGFSVRTISHQYLNLLRDFNDKLTARKMQREHGKIIFIPGDKFFLFDSRKNEYLYAAGAYDRLMQHVENNMYRIRDSIKYHYETVDESWSGDKVEFDRSTFKTHEEHEDFVWQNDAQKVGEKPTGHDIFEVQTGRGKTKAFCKIVKVLGERTMLITKPAFVEKWKKDFKEALDFRPGELLVIEDFDDLEDLMQVAKEGGLKAGKGRREVKMILTGSFVIDNYIKRYCEGERFLYSPYELLKALGVGMLGYDEVHMLFRMNYHSYIMLAPKKLVDLSATLVPDQDFNKARYKERFPEEFRFKMEYDRYIDVVSVYYNWGDRKTLRRINGMKMYNHNELEKIIMRNPKQQKSYFDMMYKLMERWYFEKHAKGHKCLVIFGMKEICTRFVQYIKLKHPDFDVARYIDGDDYNKAGKADIIVSTRGKSGTAVDYTGLTMALITTAVDDSQANLQMVGRTRKGVLRDWGITPHVVYPVCRHFNKHVKYYRNRMESFSGKVASAVTMNSSFII